MGTKTKGKAHKGSGTPPKRNYREEFADKIIAELEKGVVPWERPWAHVGMPQNATTGATYRGINQVTLYMAGRCLGSDDPRFCTFKQASDKGWKVKAGEHAVAHVERWIFDGKSEVEQTNADGQTEVVTETARLSRPYPVYSALFHASQIEGIPPYEMPTKAWEPLDVADALLQRSGAVIEHDQVGRAYYSPSKDEIHLAIRENFKSAESYYATALHELSHWTGHESRMARDLSGTFGSESYAKEELRAEIASAMLCGEIGINSTLENHASYLASWLKVLKEDKAEIVKAVGDAEKIGTFVKDLAREPQLVRETKQEVSVVQNKVRGKKRERGEERC